MSLIPALFHIADQHRQWIAGGAALQPDDVASGIAQAHCAAARGLKPVLRAAQCIPPGRTLLHHVACECCTRSKGGSPTAPEAATLTRRWACTNGACALKVLCAHMCCRAANTPAPTTAATMERRRPSISTASRPRRLARQCSPTTRQSTSMNTACYRRRRPARPPLRTMAATARCDPGRIHLVGRMHSLQIL